MSDERFVLCGGLATPKRLPKKKIINLELCGKQANVTLKISDIAERMIANVPPILIDLLKFATYVYCADQATPRGGSGAGNFGKKWRRRFRFHIPVRDPKLWSSQAVVTALRDTLGFLSDDEYTFTFKKLTQPPTIAQYLDFGEGGLAGFQPDEIVLFSGGIDSLAGAVQEAIIEKKKVALVSHRPSPKIDRRQKILLQELSQHCATGPFHVPVWIHKEKALGPEYTQRTRSFLYASLASVVARIFGLSRIRFYENGVVGINLPISAQVVGSRATRTTHPQVLNGFADLFTTIFQKPFTVENPFLWMTKAETVRSIRDAGHGALIKDSVSCTHTWGMTKLHTHCGVCSQCIDRRFAALAAGCTDNEDPEEMYGVDFLKGERSPGDDRTMVESYVRMAKQVKGMSELTFFSTFGEVHRVTKNVRGFSVDEVASRVFSLYKRHAADVCDVVTKGIQQHAAEITDGKVPSSCLLILALPDEYKKPPSFSDAPSSPLLILDDIPAAEVNPSLRACITGADRFAGLNKKIGSRELFFVYLLFKSTREQQFAGEWMTVVTEQEAGTEFGRWVDKDYLKFSGKDVDSPAHRIQKMWGEFIQQIEKDGRLKKLFTNIHKDSNGQKLYAIRLRVTETQILTSSIPGS
jgi:hypothetical protein